MRILSKVDVCTGLFFSSSQLFLAELGFYLEGIVSKGGGREGGAWEGVALVGGNHHHSFKWTSETTIFGPNLKIPMFSKAFW